MGHRDKLEIKETSNKKEVSVYSANVELDKKELELLLITIKNGMFRGEYLEEVYNLTLKLQENYLSLKDKPKS